MVEYSERARAEVRARQNNARQSKLWVNLMRFHYWIILVRPKLISENPFEKSVKSLILETTESIKGSVFLWALGADFLGQKSAT